MKLLVFNAGSSSLKYRLFHVPDGGAPAASALGGVIELLATPLDAWLAKDELAALRGEIPPFPALG